MTAAAAVPPGRARDAYHPYRSAMLSPARVRELSELQSWRPVRDVALAWAAIIGGWALAAAYTKWWTIALSIVVTGTRYYALFIVAHDGLHRRLFRNRATNDLFCDVLLLAPIGAITRINNRNHLGHHQHLATPEDPDRHKHGCFNKSDMAEVLSYFFGFTAVVTSVQNVFRGRKPAAAGGESYTWRDLAILALVQAVLIGTLTFAFGWWGWPVMWLFPVYAFTFMGDTLRSFAEHSHPESDAKSDEHRLITYESSPVEKLFLAPMNMNYHAAHHLWVSIPYYNLPKADAEMRRHPLAAELEWRRSYVGYLLRYAMALPIQECRDRPAAT